MKTRFRLLMVDDSRADLHLLETVLEDFEPDVQFTGIQKAQAALEYLQDPLHPHPSLILIDLNMPGMNGFELIERIKAMPEWRHIPLVVFSTSARENDREHAAQLGANAYLQKPTDIQGLVHVVRRLVRFWQLNDQPYDPSISTATQT